MTNYIRIIAIFIGFSLLNSTFSIAQTIDGAMLLVSQNFEDAQMDEWGYDNSIPDCQNDTLYAWDIVDWVGFDHPQAIYGGSNGSQFWGAWHTDEDICGNNFSMLPLTNAVENLFFPFVPLPANATLAEICLDYYVGALSGVSDYIDFAPNVNGFNTIERIFSGGVGTTKITTDGWVTYCKPFCLEPNISNQIRFNLNISTYEEFGWIGIDNVRLFYSTEPNTNEDECTGCLTTDTDIEEVCDMPEERYLLIIAPGTDPTEVSWELRNSEGTRIDFVTAGTYTNSLPKQHFLFLSSCESYQLKIEDANLNGWAKGYWILNYAEFPLKRGYPVISGPVPNLTQVAWGDGEAFAQVDSFQLSFPCMPTCPAPQTVEATQDCETLNFIPESIEPIVCPNTCIEATTIRVHFPSIDTTINLPATQGVTLGVGQHDAVYEVIYEDGQIVRCTAEINVVVQLNPAIVCNDLVNISLSNINTQGDLETCDVVVTPDMLLEDFIDCSDEYIVTIYDEDEEPLGNIVSPDEAGMTLIYSVTHVLTDNFCWGTLTVEDKLPPILFCTNDTLSCNNPNAFEANVQANNLNTYFGDTNELPANIAGGSAASPSVTSVALFSDMACAMKGEVVSEVSLNLRIRHSDIEDLSATLTAPNGMEVLILDHPCSGTDNMDLEATFTDLGNDIICISNANYAISGNIRPKEDNGEYDRGFSKFNDLPLLDIDGTWWLRIYDNSNSTAGSDNEVGQGELQVAQLQVRSTFRKNVEAVDCTDATVTLLNENILDVSCNGTDSLGAIITRIWQAEDDFGNISTCEQIVALVAPNFNELMLPNDVTFQCGPLTGTGSILGGSPEFDCNEILPEQHAYCDVSFTYEDEIFELCGSTFDLIRTWTLINWCSGITKYHTQTISVIDNIAPEIALTGTPMILPDTFSCMASIVLPTTLTDECSPVPTLFASYNIEGGIHNPEGTLVIVDLSDTDTIPDLPIGQTEFLFTAIDECGNDTTQMFTVTVTDLIPPIALCFDTTGMNTEIPPIHISLGSDGTAKVFVDDIDYGSYDNCGVDLVQIRREDGCGPNDTWSDDATFHCCDEANNPITLNLRVIDFAGNKHTCQREVYVEDPHPPVITCAPNDTIYCEDAAIAESLFQTPDFLDNCPVTIQTTTITDIDSVCLSGTIERTWVASDLSPKSPDVSCTQTIIVIHNSDFVVQFPADTLITNCPDSLLIVGEPIISDLDCESMTIDYEDQIFDIVPDACYKIERHWTVINKCIFSSAVLTGTGSIITSAPGMVTELPTPRTFQDDNVGKIEYTQIIKVLDTKPPFFDCPSDTIICDLDPTCMREIRLKPIVSDNCSPLALELQFKIDLDDNGTFDIVEIGGAVEGFYPYGTHRIKWIAEDGCGNTADCSYLFTIQDCFAPTPVCTNGLSITIEEGECAPIWASDFLEYATDNCTESGYLNNSVKIRLEGENEPLQSSILLCCESAGINEVEIWVEDEAGNSAFCLTYIDVQNNDGGCEGEEVLASIAGRIETPYGDWVENVVLQLNGNEASQLSQDQGFYLFNAMTINNNYNLRATKTNNPTNGVSTFDLVLITQHILALAELQSPYQLIAADVNNDGNVTTFDVVQLRQLILFLIQDFPTNTSWRFVDADYMFPNPLNPWQEAFPEYISFSPLSSNELQTDFIGIKIGDVDGSGTANSLMDTDNRNESREVFSLENTTFTANKIIEIPFLLENKSSLTGFQFSLQFDTNRLEYLGFENELLELNNSNINVLDSENGFLHFSWNTTADALTSIEKEALFKLKFKPKQSGTLKESLAFSDRHLAPEVYFNNQEKFKLDLAFAATESSPTALFQLYQNQPNPFSDETVIAFYLPTASHTQFQIFDLNGRVLYQSEQDFPKGNQHITLSANEFPNSGVYYYQLTSNGFTASQSLVVVR